MDLYWETGLEVGSSLSMAWEPPYLLVFLPKEDKHFAVLDLDSKTEARGRFVDAEDVHMCDITEEDTLEIQYSKDHVERIHPSFDFVLRGGQIPTPGIEVTQETPTRWVISVPNSEVIFLIISKPTVLLHKGKYHVIVQHDQKLVVYRIL